MKIKDFTFFLHFGNPWEGFGFWAPREEHSRATRTTKNVATQSASRQSETMQKKAKQILSRARGPFWGPKESFWGPIGQDAEIYTTIM